MLRHDRVPTHVVALAVGTLCAVQTRHSDLVCGWSSMLQERLCPLRLQSSPRLILACPSEPVCWMPNATAITGVGCGIGLSSRVCGCLFKATAGTSHHSGA